MSDMRDSRRRFGAIAQPKPDPHHRLENVKRAVTVASVAGFGGLAALAGASTHQSASSASAAQPTAPPQARHAESDENEDGSSFFTPDRQPSLFGNGGSGSFGGFGGGPVMRSGGS